MRALTVLVFLLSVSTVECEDATPLDQSAAVTPSFSLPVTTTVTDITSSTNIDDNPQKDDPEKMREEAEAKTLRTPKAKGNPNLENYSPASFRTSKRSKIENADEDAEDKATEEEQGNKPVKHVAAAAELHGKKPSAESLMADLLHEKKMFAAEQAKKKGKLKCHQKCELPMSYNQCAIPRCYYKYGAIKRLCFLLCHKQQKKCTTVCEEE